MTPGRHVDGMTTLHAAMRDRLFVVDPDDGTGRVADDLDGRAPECVAVHPERPDRVVVGTFESGLWRSTDRGSLSSERAKPSRDQTGARLPSTSRYRWVEWPPPHIYPRPDRSRPYG